MYDKCYFCLDQLPKLKKESTASFFVNFGGAGVQKSRPTLLYIVWNCCLPIADFETTGVHVNHVDSVVMPSQNKPTAWILGRKSQQEKRTLLTFQIGKMWESAVLMKILALRSGPLGKMRRRRADSLISFAKSDVMSKLNVCEQAGIYMHCPGSK